MLSAAGVRRSAIRKRPVAACGREQMDVLMGTAADARSVPLELSSARTEVPDGARGTSGLRFVLPTGGGLAYGAFDARRCAAARIFSAHVAELDGSGRARRGVGHALGGDARRSRPAAGVRRRRAAGAAARARSNRTSSSCSAISRRAFWTFLSDRARAERCARARAPAARGHRARLVGEPEIDVLLGVPIDGDHRRAASAFLERVWRRQEKIPGLDARRARRSDDGARARRARSVPACGGDSRGAARRGSRIPIGRRGSSS